MKQNITDLAGYKYLKDALGQTTDIDGGLVMTTLLALRDGDGNVQSGINGAIDPNRGKKSIATWWGGQMVDKDYNSGNLTPATSLIRFDGSGYLANGAIWWDVSGKVHADPTSFIISEKNLGAYLIFFEPTWKEGSAGTSVADLVSLKPNAPFSKLGVSGDATFEGAISFHGIKLTYDSTNKAIKIDGNLYATGGITAYGAGASTTGGGGGLNGSVKSYSNALKLTSESLSEIASAYSIKALDSRISSLEGGSATAISVSGSGNAVTSVTKNGTTISVVKGSTFLTSHQSLDGYVNAISVSGSGNAITSVSKSGKGITFTKGATFLTSHQSLANYYTKSSVDSLLSGKSATSHTHSVTINGVTKTIAATGGTAVDLGTYLTSHQSLADYAKKSEIPTKVSQLTNDTGYITSSGSCAYATSAGNADKVDGYHENSFIHWLGTKSFKEFDTIYSGGIYNMDGNTANVDGLVSRSCNQTVFNVSNYSSIRQKQLIFPYDSDTIYYRRRVDRGWTPVRIIAFTNSNVASATKLATARTIWGQSFDGTGNVSGSLSEVGNINFKVDNSYDIGSDAAASRYIYTHWLGARSGRKLELGANNSGFGQGLCIDTNLNVGISTNTPAYKLHVVGDIYSSATIRTAAQNRSIVLSNDASPAWISALEGQVIFNTGKAIRFGETAWDWNEWAGLKYTHSNKTIYLGIADNSVFNANSAQSNGTLILASITTITPDSGARIGGSGGNLYLGNANNSGWVCTQDICSQVNSSYWNITQNGSATFKSLTVTDVISCDSISVSKNAVIAGNLSVNGLLTAKAINATTADINAFGTKVNNWDGSIAANVTNMFNGIPQDNIQVEYSMDNGASWNTYPGNPENRFNLVNDNARVFNYFLGSNNMLGDTNADKLAQIKKNQLRVTVKIPDETYQELSWISVDVNNGVDIKCQVYFGSSTGGYKEYVSKIISGWSHKCDICVGPLGVNVGNDTYRYVRLVFSHPSNNTNLRNGIVAKIRALALTKYNHPNDRYTISTTGHIYDYDAYMNTYFPNSILAKGGVTAYQSSDIRLKQDLRKLDYLGIIKAMGGTFGFAWKKDNTRSIGWIAQHVLCNPHLKDIVETDEKGYYKINYWSPKLIATAFGAIEQVGDEVSRLKARVVFLESEVQRLSGDKDGNNKKRLDNKNINSLN